MRSLGTRIQRHFLVRGLWTGPFLLVFGFYGVKFLWLWLHPAVTVATGLVVIGGILVFPAAALLTGAGVAAARRDEPGQWVSMALGAAVSTVAIVLTVLAAMGVMEVLAAATQLSAESRCAAGGLAFREDFPSLSRSGSAGSRFRHAQSVWRRNVT